MNLLIGFVISNLVMPKMDGVHMMKEVSLEESLRDIPVVFCTRHFYSENSLKAKKWVARIFLSKPMISIDHLIKIIKRVIKKKIA